MRAFSFRRAADYSGVLSGVLVTLATWRHSSAELRVLLWGLLALFAAATLLAGHWPALQGVQYATSASLIAAHLLNERQCRRVAGLPRVYAHRISA